MSDKQVLIKEIDTLPAAFIEEVYHYVSFLKQFKAHVKPNEITLASEQSLAKDWLLPEEDAAWADL